MIIYIHGFGSSGHGGKASLIREYFEDEVIAPSLSYVPNLAIDTLEQLIEMLLEKGENVGLVGSSLGGYYSIYLATKYNLKAVLIRNYYDLSTFEVTAEHIQALKGLEIQDVPNQDNFITLLQTGDEVLDYNDAVEKLSESELVIEEGGTHSFENIESYFRKIGNFLNN